MRERRGRGERRLEDALEGLRRALNAAGAPWMVIGGIAVIGRGVRRVTTDIDAVVQGDAVEIGSLLNTLARYKIVPRIPNATVFAQTNMILLVTHEPTSVELDISMGWTGFEHRALDARSDVTFGPITAPMASAEDLIIFKALAARPKDIDDATTLLALYPAIDLTRVRKELRVLAELVDEPDRIKGLERMIKAARRASPDRAIARTKRQAAPKRPTKRKR